MREKDFEAIAMARILKAYQNEDCATLGAFLVENYTEEVQQAACGALKDIASEDSVRILLDILFGIDSDVETKALIIRTLSDIMTEEDMEQIKVDYNVAADTVSMKVFRVLRRCIAQ